MPHENPIMEEWETNRKRVTEKDLYPQVPRSKRLFAGKSHIPKGYLAGKLSDLKRKPALGIRIEENIAGADQCDQKENP